jgi:hypothetical protein
MALRIVWRNPLLSIRTEQTPQQIISDEFGVPCAVTAPDLMAETDATVLLVEHGLVLDRTGLALISPRLWLLLFPPRGSHTSDSYRP